MDDCAVPCKLQIMKNITLAVDEKILEAGRSYARRRGTTLNALVRDLLVKAVAADRQTAVSEMFRLMDAYPGNSREQQWTREELHDRQGLSHQTDVS
jgi:hypothetical protein